MEKETCENLQKFIPTKESLQIEIDSLTQELAVLSENETYKLICTKIGEISDSIRERKYLLSDLKNRELREKKLIEMSPITAAARAAETQKQKEERRKKSEKLQVSYRKNSDGKIYREFYIIFNPIVQNCIGLTYLDAVSYLKENGISEIEDYTHGGYLFLRSFRVRLYCDDKKIVERAELDWTG